jgi:recombination protein RecT
MSTKNKTAAKTAAPAEATPPAETQIQKTAKTASGSQEELYIHKVLGRINDITQGGDIVIPKDYSPENALKEAYLKLVQTVDRNKKPVLQVCSHESIVNALLDMVVQGLTPAKAQCYFIPFGQQLTLLRSYMGTVAVAKRIGGVANVNAQVIYEGDGFEYEIDPDTGEIEIVKHTQSLGNIDVSKIQAVYAVVTLKDGTKHVELMTRAQVQQAWKQGSTKGGSETHTRFAEEMAKKSVINRACKRFINTSDDSDILTAAYNRTTENDYIDQSAGATKADDHNESAAEISKLLFGSGEQPVEVEAEIVSDPDIIPNDHDPALDEIEAQNADLSDGNPDSEQVVDDGSEIGPEDIAAAQAYISGGGSDGE